MTEAACAGGHCKANVYGRRLETLSRPADVAQNASKKASPVREGNVRSGRSKAGIHGAVDMRSNGLGCLLRNSRSWPCRTRARNRYLDPGG